MLAATAVVVGELELGFAAASASSDPDDPVMEMCGMHDEMHASHGGMAVGGHTSAEMDEMSARLSQEDRALHDRHARSVQRPH